jgi:hypothetical protein
VQKKSIDEFQRVDRLFLDASPVMVRSVVIAIGKRDTSLVDVDLLDARVADGRFLCVAAEILERRFCW